MIRAYYSSMRRNVRALSWKDEMEGVKGVHFCSAVAVQRVLCKVQDRRGTGDSHSNSVLEQPH